MSTTVESIDSDAAIAYDTPLGITNPPIDELLDRVSSKYALVIYAAKRARQINDYYADLHEGSLFDNVGPLVDSTRVQPTRKPGSAPAGPRKPSAQQPSGARNRSEGGR